MAHRKRDAYDSGSPLTPLELKLIRALEAGDAFGFVPADLAGRDAYVRAGLIRAILIGMDVRIPCSRSVIGVQMPDEVRPVRLLGAGVRVRPAVLPATEQDRRALARLPIRGRLELAQLRAEGGTSLPALELSYCVFDATIDLSGACLGPISFEGSRFELLLARDSAISGGVNLQWCGSSGAGAAVQADHFPFRGTLASGNGGGSDEDSDTFPPLPADHALATCVVNLHAANISGSVNLSYSDFCREKEQVDPSRGTPISAAVNLGSASVRDTVMIDETLILGGINFNGSEIGEGLWFTGARTFGYGYAEHAINLQYAKIGGLLAFRELNMHMRKGFKLPMLFGTVFALAVQAHEIWLSSGPFVGIFRFSKARVALGFTLGGYLGEGSAAFNGNLSLDDAMIGGNLEFTGVEKVNQALLDAVEDEDHAFYNSRMQYKIDAFAQGWAPGLRVEGAITVRRSTFFVPPAEVIASVLNLAGARVSSDVNIDTVTLEGGLNLRAARIEGGLLLADTTFDLRRYQPAEAVNPRAGDQRTALMLRDCVCGRELEVRRLRWPRQLSVGAEGPAHRLDFYRDCAIVEQHDDRQRYRRLLCDLRGKFLPILIDGTSAPIHAFNANFGRLDLSSEAKRRDYLTFFCDAVTGGEGPFKIVGKLDVPLDVADAAFKPLRELPPDDSADPPGPAGSWTFEATVFYSNALFHAKFRLLSSGMVEMVDDDPIAADLPVAIPDRYPNRPDWQQVEPRIEPRSYLSEPLDAAARAKVATPLPTAETEGEVNALARALRPLRSNAAHSVDLAADAAAKSVAIVDLQGFQCAALIDAFGAEWGFPGNQQDHPRIWLKVAGIRCQRVQPSAHGGAAIGSSLEIGDATKRFGEATRSSAASGAPDQRIIWLSHQFGRRPASGAWPPATLWSRFAGRSAAGWAESSDFIPQTYDEFATAHYRAGEPGDGQKILIEKKDIQKAVAFRSGWRARFPAGKPWTTARTLAMLAAGLVGLAWSCLASAGATDSPAGVIVPAASGLLLLYAAWPVVLVTILGAFKLGFRYGLSPNSALATCTALLLLGWGATHYARTGSWLTTPDWDQYVSSGHKLPDDIALVLKVNFEPAAKEPSGAKGALKSLRSEGTALYAAPTPCNVGVSSLLYAADVFIPLLDLDQEERCTIRPSPDRERFDRYGWWRLGKALYELVGWIVISLTIITISGVVRRDIER